MIEAIACSKTKELDSILKVDEITFNEMTFTQ